MLHCISNKLHGEPGIASTSNKSEPVGRATSEAVCDVRRSQARLLSPTSRHLRPSRQLSPRLFRSSSSVRGEGPTASAPSRSPSTSFSSKAHLHSSDRAPSQGALGAPRHSMAKCNIASRGSARVTTTPRGGSSPCLGRAQRPVTSASRSIAVPRRPESPGEAGRPPERRHSKPTADTERRRGSHVEACAMNTVRTLDSETRTSQVESGQVGNCDTFDCMSLSPFIEAAFSDHSVNGSAELSCGRASVDEIEKLEGLRHQNQVLLKAQQEAIASQQASIEELHGKFDELLHVLKADQRAKLGLDTEPAAEKCSVQEASRQPQSEEIEIPSPRHHRMVSCDAFFHPEVQTPSKSTWPLHFSGCHQHASVVVPVPVAQISCSAEPVAWKAARGDTVGKTSLVIRSAGLRSASPPGRSPTCAVTRQSSQQRLDSRRVTVHCTPLAVTPVMSRGVNGFATAH